MRNLFLVLILFSNLLYAQQTPPGDYPQASQKILTLKDIIDLSEAEVKLMRNEIFARYGYIFKNPELKAHFEKQAWYKPTSPDVTSSLTETEKKNIDLLKKQEQRIRTTANFDDFYEAFKSAIEHDNVEKIVELAHSDRMGGDAQVRESFRSRWEKFKTAIVTESYPDSSGGSTSLVYETRLDGDQSEYVVFEKIGSCWYITGFDSAG